jgi:hypothetical protein
MTIPDDSIIQMNILSLLATAADRRMHVQTIYDELAKLHDELTPQEMSQRYDNSVSKWANRIQFAKHHLVYKDLIHRAGSGPNPSHGIWIITEAGRKVAGHDDGVDDDSKQLSIVAGVLEATMTKTPID